jgi:6-pyruvoyltetrahydropterin/6-carboxytetrahydropterin synthase
MTVVRVTRRAHFSSAHRLHRDDWSDERNRDVFGDCSNPNWHGHNYTVDVTVEGPVDPETGFVMDLKALKEALAERVVVDVDHRNLNLEVPWMEGVMPSTENFAVAIWDRLADALPSGVRMCRVVLRETPNNSVEYTGSEEHP